MSQVKITINGEREFVSNHPLITIGRTSDNNIALDDSNVSRYHARIEQRKDGYWLVEQGSSNGTAVNDTEVDGEILLQDGDKILFGGSAELLFNLEGAAKPAEAGDADKDKAAGGEEKKEAAPAEESKSLLTMIALAVLGLAFIAVLIAGLVYWWSSTKACDAKATFLSPESGEILNAATDVEVEIDRPQCIQAAIFTLDGQELATATSEPFKATIDPRALPDFADGLDHSLRVILVDVKGVRIPQAEEVLLAFETATTEPPKPDVADVQTGKPTPPQATESKKVSAIETQDMLKRLLTQFPGSNYKINQEFIVEVNKRQAEFIAEGFFARSQQYRDAINVAFVTEQNLDPPLGYILAMSRSKFNPQPQGGETGLWRMSPDFVKANSFDVVCGGETINDKSQVCAAKAAAIYLKAIILNVFEGDIIYGIAAFGMSPGEASAWKATLPANRQDFWKIIRTPKQRDELVRFFAAASVAENPQKFGLKNDRPISENYRNLMGN